MIAIHLTKLKDYEANLKNLSDEDVLKQLGSLFQREKHLADAILINLQETYHRRLYAKAGYSSMFEMLVKHFGHSESAAYQRTSALKLIQVVPAAKEALAKGETTMTTMAETQKFIAKVEKETSLNAKDKEAIFNQVKGKTRQETLTLFAELHPVAALPETKEKPLTDKHTLLQVTVEHETLELIHELKDLLSHEIPNGDLNLVLKRIAKIGLDNLKKTKGRSESKKEMQTLIDSETRELTEQDLLSEKPCAKNLVNSTNPFTSSIYRQKRKAIPIEVRRQVFARGNYRCEFVSENGHRCESKHQLEVDHRLPYSQGGSNDYGNLQICCSNHNRYRTKLTHGFWFQRPI